MGVMPEAEAAAPDEVAKDAVSVERASAPAVASKATVAPKAAAEAERKKKEKAEEKEKQATLANALMRKENRDTATVLVFFASALAIMPVGGLLICEAALREFRGQ